VAFGSAEAPRKDERRVCTPSAFACAPVAPAAAAATIAASAESLPFVPRAAAAAAVLPPLRRLAAKVHTSSSSCSSASITSTGEVVSYSAPTMLDDVDVESFEGFWLLLRVCLLRVVEDERAALLPPPLLTLL